MRCHAWIAAAAGLLGVFGSILAHHSGSFYDQENPITMTGTVTEIAMVNPHTLIRLEVTNETGQVVHWTVELGAPIKLFRAGWTKESIKPGDQITVTGPPAKDGRKVMEIFKLVAPNGRVLLENQDGS